MTDSEVEPDGIYGRFTAVADRNGTDVFLWFEGTEWTYGEASTAVDRRSTMLGTRGIDAGDRVGLLLPNSPEFLFTFFAVQKLGAVAVILDYRQENDVLEHLLVDADLDLLVADRATYDHVWKIRESLPGNLSVLTHDVADPKSDDIDIGHALASTRNQATVERSRVDPSDTAVVNYTSGTTGPPKGVPNPHRSFLDAGERVATACGLDASDRALLVLPLFHANPLTYGLMGTLAVGGSVAPVRSFSASGFFETARHSGATYFTHVGSILEILIRTATEGSIDPDTPLKFGYGGAAHVPPKRAREFEILCALQVVRLYGLSEVGAGLVTSCEYDPGADCGQDHQGSIKSQPFDVRILDQDANDWCDVGERGEIVVRPERPATMFHGYSGKAETTVNDWQDLWMHTGDLGWIDDAGSLHFVGRITTSIRRMGENVSPWEIETVVEAFDDVAEAVAVGVPDEVAGEEIHLYVVTDGDVTVARLYEQCRSGLAERLVPRYISVVESLPKTSTRKIERVALAQRGTEYAWDAETDQRQ